MSKYSPPKYWLRFFKWFCDPDLHPFIEGDLYELYSERIQELGKKKADRRFARDVLLLFRPGIIRSFNWLEKLINQYLMWKSYFKIGWRNLLKHRFFSLINVIGMTIGMGCFLLIALYIQYETSYDRQHERADRTYRVSQWQQGNELMGTDRFAFASLPVAPTLKEEFPEIEAATTIAVNTVGFSKDEQPLTERILFADEHLFDVFTYPVIEGEGAEALRDPNAIILTESMAHKYFGNDSPIGKSLLFDEERPLTVRGVIEDVPSNQHFHFNGITSIRNTPYYQEDAGRWNHNNYHVYITLPAGYDYRALESKLPDMGRHFAAAYASFPFQPRLFLQPLTDIHLHSRLNAEIEANGDIRYVYFSASIAFIILLLAAINYMNLTNARSGQRSREVGVRKVLGAKKGHLVSQLMAESMLIIFSSMAIGLVIAYFCLPAFNRLLAQEIPYDLGNNGMVLVGLLLSAILLTLLSGLYPAIRSSTGNPVKALKGSLFSVRKDGVSLRNVLVVSQFTAAIILAIGSLVIYQQLRYIQHKKLGYNRDQIVFVPYGDQKILEKSTTIRAELGKISDITQLTIADNMPIHFTSDNLVNQWEGNHENKEMVIYRNRTDHQFLDLFEIDLVEGRNFSQVSLSDTTNQYILNETAVKALGWESGLGKRFKDGAVIGVVRDFHFQNLNQAIKPLFMEYLHPEYSRYGAVALKVKPDKTNEVLAEVEQVFKELMPDMLFQYQFMDESYMGLYEAEKRFGRVFSIFTVIALFIACMGLLGLVTHRILQRTREIGIRKVLGASVSGIVQLISGDFLKLVILAIILAIPLAWWGMSQWLMNFAYRIDLSWWMFGLVGLLAIGLAFLTVSLQAVRAAVANPVESLRVE